jgi:nucleotide-binding universal stress UspA family protein
MRPLVLRSILAATDLTATSNEVLRAAAALAALSGAALHIVHAAPAPARSAGEPEIESERARQRRIAEARAALTEQIRHAVPRHVTPTSMEIVFEQPYRAILDRATAAEADLIVIGPHRPRPVGERHLGTTADRVVRTAEQPVLIVREPLSLPLRRVLVPTDLSEAARGALYVGLSWTSALRVPSGTDAPRTALDVVHVAPPLAPGDRKQQRHATVDAALRREIETVLEYGGGTGLAIERELIEASEPADAIARLARQMRADLVVIGTHGDTGLMRALLGSVASAVARRTSRPVLLVPPEVWRRAIADDEAVAS